VAWSTDVWFSVRTGNYVPLTTIIGYLSGEPSWQIAIVNLLGNIILFVPFGIFLPLIFRSMTGKKVVAYAIVCSVTLEICQIFLMGTPDIDDVFLNTLGALIGYFAWRLVRK
jgi:glycopeptide antibiotics resistance protein